MLELSKAINHCLHRANVSLCGQTRKAATHTLNKSFADLEHCNYTGSSVQTQSHFSSE